MRFNEKSEPKPTADTVPMQALLKFSFEKKNGRPSGAATSLHALIACR